MRHVARIARITIAIAAVTLVGCKPAAQRGGDSLPPIDTLKPAVAGDTLPTTPKDSVAAKTPPASTKTKAKGELRDSAFGPPRNLPRLDTVPTKRRPPA